MTQGKVLYFEQVDNLSGKGIYRMHIAESSANRLVFDVENVSTMRYHYIPLVDPGEMQSIYFLDRESDNVWRYYSVMRTGRNVNRGSREMSLPRSTGPSRSIATSSGSPPIRSRRRRDDGTQRASRSVVGRRCARTPGVRPYYKGVDRRRRHRLRPRDLACCG